MQLQETVIPGGDAIIATFAIDGPECCGGLEVMRYDARSIRAVLGPGFELLQAIHEAHMTPGQVVQRFTYFVFQRLGSHE